MIISVVNQKGGVGKTTTAVNLATAFAACVKKVLIIDMDPQGNATSGFGIDQRDRTNTIYELINGARSIDETIINTQIPNLDIIPSNMNLVAAEFELSTKSNREFILKNELATVSNIYDYIVIDCPPSLGLLTINALCASESVLIPMQCEFYSLEGLSHLLKTIELVKRSLNTRLSIKGILLTMYDRRNNLTQEIERDVRGCMGDLVFKSTIPRNVRISEAPSHGKPVIIYDHRCVGAIAYMHLAREIMG